jgi:hypothetical protein
MEFEHIKSAEPASSAPGSSEEVYSRAVERIPRFMIGVGMALGVAAWWRFGRAAGLGFFGGAVIAFLNFRWLKDGVNGLADRVVSAGKPQSGTGVIVRFLMRYVLMGAAAYVILTSFPASLRGLFAGIVPAGRRHRLRSCV